MYGVKSVIIDSVKQLVLFIVFVSHVDYRKKASSLWCVQHDECALAVIVIYTRMDQPVVSPDQDQSIFGLRTGYYRL